MQTDVLNPRAICAIAAAAILVMLMVVVVVVNVSSDYRDHAKACHVHGMQYWQDRDVCVIERPVP